MTKNIFLVVVGFMAFLFLFFAFSGLAFITLPHFFRNASDPLLVSASIFSFFAMLIISCGVIIKEFLGS